VLVRTRGYGGRGAGDGRSWLLIKHRDDWSGDVDITDFAPLSVKSGHDLHEILAEDNPDIWHTNRPVAGGETGAMLRDIIQKAAALKAGRTLTVEVQPAAKPKAAKSRRSAPKAAKAAATRAAPRKRR
jgi:hypothetical protein